MIDDREIQEVERCLEAFDTAYVDLIQATQRLLRLAEMDRKPVAATIDNDHTIDHGGPVRRKADPAAGQSTGNFCDRCNSTNLRRSGAGCVGCLDCGFSGGCSG